MAAAPTSGFKLVGRHPEKAPIGSAVILYCYLSPKKNAAAMEIRWFRETDCVCLYKDRQMKEGRGYAGRVSLFTHELERGNASLLLRECRGCDIGTYLCQVTCGDRTEELTSRLWWRPLQSVFGCAMGGIPYVNIEQWFRKWTQEERVKMEDSALLTEYNTDVKSLQKELKERQSLLEMSAEQLRSVKLDWERAEEELQKKSSQIQMTVVVLEQLKSELAEKTKQLEEKDRLLTETETRLIDIEKQTEEKDRLPEEMKTKRQEFTDSSAAVRKTCSKELETQTETEVLSDPESPAAASELRLVLLGRSGCGKSAAGNTILGAEDRSQAGASTVRQQSESRQGEVAGRKVTVVETPDWFSPGLSLEELRQDVEHCVCLSAPGPHAFLLVIPVNQSTGEERGMLEKMEEIFGEKCWRNTMILFTGADEVPEKIIKRFIQSEDQNGQRLMQKCGNRFHCLKIEKFGDGSQISELLKKIEKMLEGNEDSFYSSGIYLKGNSAITEMEEAITLEEEKKAKEDESLRKIQGVIQEHDQDVREMIRQTNELKGRNKDEKEDKQITEQERRMDETHGQEIREMTEGEARMKEESNIMQVNLLEVEASKLKMEEEFSRQIQQKDIEMEKLKQRLLELEEVYHQEIKPKSKNLEGEASGSSKKKNGMKKLLQSELI